MSGHTNFNVLRARKVIQEANTVSVLTGAGISTDSGIPDFRGPNGIWTKDPDAEKLSTIDYYKSSPVIRNKSWERYMLHDWNSYSPNAGHMAIKKLYDDEKLLHLATQNIDGLHKRSGIPPERISEIHGCAQEAMCLECEAIFTDKIENKDCPVCGGLLKPNVIYFGEDLVASVWHKAEAAAISCDAYLVVGTSLMVWPAADLPSYAEASGATIIYVNGDKPPTHVHCDIELIGSISDILPKII